VEGYILGKRCVALVAAMLIVGMLDVPGTSSAAVPGRNGKIAYLGPLGITLVNPDGTGERALGVLAYCFSFAPDGKTIVFRSMVDGEVYLINSDGTGLRPLSRRLACVDWSPDGTMLTGYECSAYPCYHPWIFTTDADGTNVRWISPGSSTPAWSPDGTKLAFIVNQATVVIHNLDGSGSRVVAHAGEWNPHLDWSPDGTRVLYYDWRSRDIWTVDIRTGDHQNITRTPDRSESSAQWSPDGKQIVFSIDDPDRCHIFCVATIGTDGSGMRVLARFTDEEVDWAVRPDTSG
jgi:Tol biopolymer transport system component